MSINIDFEKAKSYLQEALDSSYSFKSKVLDKKIQEGIIQIINGEHLTFRYLLLTALLAKRTEPKIHMRCLQAGSKLKEAYDARSLCHKIIVPFEKEALEGKLGSSNEPFLNKPARYPSIELNNPIRGGKDKKMLGILFVLLNKLNASSTEHNKEALTFAIEQITKKQGKDSERVERQINLDPDLSYLKACYKFKSFLKESHEGQTPVAVLGSFFRTCLGSRATVVVHPVNQAGSSSKEIGDVEVRFASGRIIAVEVKDKTFSKTDVSHAIEKVLKVGENKLIFATGIHSNGEKTFCLNLQKEFFDNNFDLTFLNIATYVEIMLSLFPETLRKQTILNLYNILYEMRAKDLVIKDFEKIFKL